MVDRCITCSRTFKHAYDPKEDVVIQYMFIKAKIIKHDWK